MIDDKLKKLLKKQHYFIVGEHSAVQICRWNKKSLTGEGCCYKEKFYGIKSHLCCQMTPSLWCPNKCLHCWRAIEYFNGNKIKGKINSASEIIDGCIKAQRKLLNGFGSNKKLNKEKFLESREPMNFAISLSGEPMIYNKIGELIFELRKRGKTSFLVSNGLYPEKIRELIKKKQLPTQLYISVNTPNKEFYSKFHRSSMKNAWEKLNKSLELMSKMTPNQVPSRSERGLKKSVPPKFKVGGKTRTVVRINLVKDLNMTEPENYVKLIQKAKPMFIEIKGYVAVGYARERLGYDRMPWHKDIVDFSKKILKELKRLNPKSKYKILGEHEFSKVVIMGKDKREMKIKEKEI